jgi:polyhydroxybutyrate depolymerase
VAEFLQLHARPIGKASMFSDERASELMDQIMEMSMKRCALMVSTLLALAGLVQAQPAIPPATFPATASQPATQPDMAGNRVRTLEVDGNARTYLVHLPPKFDGKKPAPVVLIFHGAWANAAIQAAFSGMSKKADIAGFVAVYPNGLGGTFNAWAKPSATGRPADDVKFVSRLLDDLATFINVDAKRVYATGMSNGGMMCYRLAAELSDRIAAVAPVAGTLCIDKPSPTRPVPVIHFHGTADTLVPFNGPDQRTPKFLNFKSVEDTVRTWVDLNGCPEKPETTNLSDTAKDGTTVTRKVYGPGKDGAEVILYVIEGGGHTWPGQNPIVGFLGKSTGDIVANDLIWEFFQKHPMKAAPAGASAGGEAFEAKCQRAADGVKITVEDGRAIFTVTSPAGIGKATIDCKGVQWPKQIVLRLQLRGLESLEVSCGDAAVSAAVSSHGDFATRQHLLKNGKEGSPLTKDSPYWLAVRMLDASGKSAKGLPGKDGCFEVTIPKAFLDEKPKTMKLSWIDFYR